MDWGGVGRRAEFVGFGEGEGAGGADLPGLVLFGGHGGVCLVVLVNNWSGVLFWLEEGEVDRDGRAYIYCVY